MVLYLQRKNFCQKKYKLGVYVLTICNFGSKSAAYSPLEVLYTRNDVLLEVLYIPGTMFCKCYKTNPEGVQY